MIDLEITLIERLLSDFAWYADWNDAVGLASLFTDDGILSVGGRLSEGRQHIESDCQKRFDISGRKTRHVWSNLRIDALTERTASITTVQSTFESLGVDSPTRLRVNDVIDELRKDPTGAWRFSSRLIRCEFALSL